MTPASYPSVNIKTQRIPREILRLFSFELMKKYSFIPFAVENERLCIAIDDPADISRVDTIRAMTTLDLTLFSAPRENIWETLISRLTDLDDSIQSSELAAEEKEVSKVINGSEVTTGNESVIVSMINKIFELAIARRASDIHIEPQSNGLFLRIRIDGILNTVHKFSKTFQQQMTARIKILAELDITEKRLPQDGQIDYPINNRTVNLRLSTLPGKYGEKIVIRILDKSSFALELSHLGFDAMMQANFETLIEKPQGLLLVTGPTGSGKTTTLYSVLNRLRSPVRNVITLEDPVEYELLAGKDNEAGITQVQVNPKIGLTFASALRSSLRQDPDIIMVGEIRDRETAEIAMQSALTGHLVLSTLHTNDAPSTLLRLRDMGIEPYLIGSTVIGILAQRLVRTLCPACKQSYRPPDRVLRLLFPTVNDFPPDLMLFRSHGCEECQFSGYKGRAGIFELLIMNDELKMIIASGGSSRQIQEYMIKNKVMPLRENGLTLVKQGLTTIEEVFRVSVE